MKQKAYVFVFDGLGDWEPALALCQITKSGKYEVFTVGHSRATVTTMGGLKVLPDVAIDEIDSGEAAIFIVPGGNTWEEGPDQKVEELLRRPHGECSDRRAVRGDFGNRARGSRAESAIPAMRKVT